MTKNITLKLDENILKSCRFKAVEENKSLSSWVSDLLKREIETRNLDQSVVYRIASEKAIRLIRKGYTLGGKPIPRGTIYD